MTGLTAGKEASFGLDRATRYARHRPEQTRLHQIVPTHYPTFVAELAARERRLPDYVQREFEEYLACGRLEHGFLRVRCADCHAERLVAFSCKRRGFCPSCGARRMAESAALLVDEIFPRLPIRQWVLSVPFALRFLLAREPHLISPVLGIVTRGISNYLINQAGCTAASAQTGAVTLIQRFGSALNLNIHFHMLFLDGVYRGTAADLSFQRAKAPTVVELVRLVHTLSERIARHLERRGLLVREPENDFLTIAAKDDSTFDELRGHSITYRIALGPHAGRKVFTLQTLPNTGESAHGAARANGFSLHAGVVAASDERDKLERLCRYITRPAVSTERLSLTVQGLIHYRLKTPYRDGTTHVVFEPLDFIARLAALVPNPRVNLTRYHGVFAPNHHLRARVTPARRGRRSTASTEEPPAHRHAAMSWAQRLKRVFKIEIETCATCGGPMKVIAAITEPVVIKRILAHLEHSASTAQHPEHPPRAPPPLTLPDLME